MRKLLPLILFLTPVFKTSAQFYIRGEVKDDKNQPLQNVKIYLLSNGLFYSSGITGGFGITTKEQYDSLTFSLDGFETKTFRVKADEYQHVVLNPLSGNTVTQKPKLFSVAKNIQNEFYRRWLLSDESYSNLIENGFIEADKYPNTAFSVRVDKASYSNVRRFINQNSLVPPDAVRIEEMLNYFNFNYKEPDKNDIFKIESQLTSCPWNVAHQLLYINLSAKKLNLEKVPPSNFVFLIDVSGSMDMPNRLPLLKGAFQLLVKNLREKDTVSIVIYGGSVGVWLQPTSGIEKQKIVKAIEELEPGGSTPGEAAIKTAYIIAKRNFIKGGNNRIILATDGDFNIGQTNEKELEEMIANERQSGVYLTCLGVGMGNYKDSKIEALAKKGNGNFAYLDDIREGEKVLVTEFTQTLYTVANDVYLNVQFKPEKVKSFRLIGYDNKKDVVDTNAQLEGGEIGSGNGMTAVFEILPNRDTIIKNHDLLTDTIANVMVNYRQPPDSSTKKFNYTCLQNFKSFNDICNELRFASAVTMFGLVLRQSKYIGSVGLKEVGILAAESVNKDDYLQNEFLNLVEKAKKIYSKKKKRRSSSFN